MFVIMLMPKAGQLHNAEAMNLAQSQFFRFRISVNPIDDSSAESYEYRTVNFANDRPSADQLAELMASKHPGSDVYIMEAVGVFSSSVPEVVQKQITKEGILPF